MPHIPQRVREFLERLNFTPTERIVVLSLVGAFLAGLGIRFFNGGGARLPAVDYSAIDSEFVARSTGARTTAAAKRRDRQATEASLPRTPAPGSVHINIAAKAELMTLPGVGETIAGRIIRERTDHGRFTSVRDLLRVKGIGERKLRRLAPFCTVEK